MKQDNNDMREAFESFMATRCYVAAYDDVQGHYLFKEMLFEYFQAAYQLQQQKIDELDEEAYNIQVKLVSQIDELQTKLDKAVEALEKIVSMCGYIEDSNDQRTAQQALAEIRGK